MDMNDIMNNPQAMAMMQAMQSDPELMMMMQRPGVMEKFMAMQQNMGDMNAMQAYMQDPDISAIVMRMQGMGMGGGGGGMNNFGGGFGNNNNSTNAYSGQQTSASSGLLQHGSAFYLENSSDYVAIINNAEKIPVIVDFTASWCGPCKRISPVFEELASEFKGRAVFLKVDGDKHKTLVQQNGVKGFPTFRMYVAGQVVEEFSGADVNRLRDVVERFSKALKPAVTYVHFPVKSEELVSFKKAKYDAIVSQIVKGSGNLVDQSQSLSDGDVKTITAITAALQNKLQFHKFTFSNEQLDILDKILSWPNLNIAGPLNLTRMCALHPHFASTYAKRHIDGKSLTFIGRVAQVVADAPKPSVCVLALRTLANSFNRRVMGKQMAAQIEDVLEACSAALDAFPEDSNVRLTVASLMINYAVLFSENVSTYADEKVQLLSCTIDRIDNGVNKVVEPAMMYRLLVVMGTLLYQDGNSIALARDLDTITLLERVQNAFFMSEADIVPILKELRLVFERNPESA